MGEKKDGVLLIEKKAEIVANERKAVIYSPQKRKDKEFDVIVNFQFILTTR